MVDDAVLRRLAAALPETTVEEDGKGWTACKVAGKQFAWTWNERVAPKKPRIPRPGVFAIRCPLERKAMLIAARPEAFFDEPHYLGFPAVLVRLAAIDEPELAALLRAAWTIQAPKALAKTLLA